ncbi:SLAM family member 5 [Rhea pennata]|uniref:SLAM family member 5 n=1 Tax=Rhea pennata TaxID=8795 RepID=UPI002E253973
MLCRGARRAVGGCQESPTALGAGGSPPRRCRVETVAGVAMALLVLLPQAAAQAGQPAVHGAVAGEAYLSAGRQNRPAYQVHWRYGNTQKIAIRKGSETPSYPDPLFHRRLELFPNNTLRVRCLRKSDSGTYWLYLEDGAGREHTESVRLTVHEPVPKPTVRAEMEGDAEHCEVNLTCSVALEDVTYEWILPRQRLAESPGAQLHLSFSPVVETYTCRASNPVSSSNASLTYRHPCSWEAEPSVAQKTEVPSALAFLLLLLLV